MAKKNVSFEFEGYYINASGHYSLVSDTLTDIEYESDSPIPDDMDQIVLDYCRDLLESEGELEF